MSEHMFQSGGHDHTAGLLDDVLATELGAELAESILVEIARAEHSWVRIGRLAAMLARISEAVSI